MEQLNIVYKPIKDLKPYKNNAKKHPKEQVERIANSIKEFGFLEHRAIAIDKDNVVVEGHGRILAAKKAGLKEVPTVCIDFMTDEQLKAWRMIENKTAESAWDDVLLKNEMEGLGLDMSLFGFDLGEEADERESKYSMEINIPHYEIKGEAPDLSELVDKTKTNELLNRIKDADIPEEIKKFLRLGAYRHLKFNYSKIAEFYAQADKETQELMEQSALVIIDFDDALREGYVQLSDKLFGLIGEGGEDE